MKVAVLIDHVFSIDPHGEVWTADIFPYSFWTRYLSCFSEVIVVARTRRVRTAPAYSRRASGPRVKFKSVPAYKGPWQYATTLVSTLLSALRALRQVEAVILRMPGAVPLCVLPTLLLTRRPYGVEIVGDPWDTFSPGTGRHPLRWLLRIIFTTALRVCCRKAVATAYVTEQALQSRYPGHPRAFTTHYSSIELEDDYLAASPRRMSDFLHRPFRLICVGSFGWLYKGQDDLVNAFQILASNGVQCELIFVGDGAGVTRVKTLVAKYALSSSIMFVGALPGSAAVKVELDRSQLFVLPSRQEGLPRAMIEAMARGLPCIGTTVGGIPELISPECLVEPNNPAKLAAKIHLFYESPTLLEKLSSQNLIRAQFYLQRNLVPRRDRMYKALRDRTPRRGL